MKWCVKWLMVVEGLKYFVVCYCEFCYLCVFGFCCLNLIDEIVVLCYLNQVCYGKVGVMKVRNEFMVFGCGLCYVWIDQNCVGMFKQVKFDMWDCVFEEWVLVCV